MQKVFYGTLISNAKYQLKNLEHLLIRAEHGFFLEKSLDQVIFELNKTQQDLVLAKESYITHQVHHNPSPQSHPQAHLHTSVLS
jgi:hypothetical protein